MQAAFGSSLMQRNSCNKCGKSLQMLMNVLGTLLGVPMAASILTEDIFALVQWDTS